MGFVIGDGHDGEDNDINFEGGGGGSNWTLRPTRSLDLFMAMMVVDDEVVSAVATMMLITMLMIMAMVDNNVNVNYYDNIVMAVVMMAMVTMTLNVAIMTIFM